MKLQLSTALTVRIGVVMALFSIGAIWIGMMSFSPNALSLEVLTPASTDLYQVSYDRGQGFREDDSQIGTVISRPTIQIHRFTLPWRQIEAFQIIPWMAPGEATILAIRVEHEFQRAAIRMPLRTWRGASLIQAFRPVHDLGELFQTRQGTIITVTGSDPQLQYAGEIEHLRQHLAQTQRQIKLWLALFWLIVAGLAVGLLSLIPLAWRAMRGMLLRIRNTLVLPPRLFFCAGLAAAMVGLRLLCFDYANFFQLYTIPNHDMYQGLSFFTTNMHAMRLSGEIAWWNPISNNGYAQAYQAFFAPLAPTPHHIVFLVWAQGIRVLQWFQLAIPEYVQYLILTYILLPFLTFCAFTALCCLVFRSRITVTLMLLVYTLSGIGLWYSALFYFQESFSLFCLLAALIGFLQKPRLSRLALTLIAILIQASSINYWTVYNSWFFVIFLGAYCVVYPQHLWRVSRMLTDLFLRQKRAVCLVSVMMAIPLMLWGVMMGLLINENASQYLRRGHCNSYTIGDASELVQPIRTFTAELLNPNIHTGVEDSETPNAMMNARYLGVSLIPLLLIALVVPWQARERWLVTSAIGVLMVCLAPPFLLVAWKATPFMDTIQHFFNFYSHYWQIAVVFLAGAGLDRLCQSRYDPPTSKRICVVLYGLLGICLLALGGFFLFASAFPKEIHNVSNQALQGNLHFLLLTALSSLLLAQVCRSSGASRRLLLMLFLLLMLTDVSRYFQQVNLLDRAFTITTNQTRIPLTDEVTQRLRAPWSLAAPISDFSAGVMGNLPISTHFWPKNTYIRHAYFRWFDETPKLFRQQNFEGPALEFFHRAMTLSEEEVYDGFTEFYAQKQPFQSPLVLHGIPQHQEGLATMPAQSVPQVFTATWYEWRYNTFRFAVQVPQAGWLLIRQLYDPRWIVTIDEVPVQATRANYIGMAIPVPEGRHDIRMDYQPLARRLYWPAGFSLEGSIVILLLVAFAKRSIKK